MTFVDNISPEDLLTLTASIATSLSKDKNIDEINLVGNFFIAVGRSMLIISSKEQYLSSIKHSTNDSVSINKDNALIDS